MSDENEIVIPSHLEAYHLPRLYRLLVRAYSPDHGQNWDDNTEQDLLCDNCGVTSCGTRGCACKDVLCPHGRTNLRSASGTPSGGTLREVMDIKSESEAWKNRATRWAVEVRLALDENEMLRANLKRTVDISDIRKIMEVFDATKREHPVTAARALTRALREVMKLDQSGDTERVASAPTEFDKEAREDG